ncbi:transposase [Thalassotalea sp. ND16A]|uniref:transposase n=1 Tax=Thalassotalea sp. ND16A TaxID=1535422 RepID=UPI000690A246
MSLTHDEFIRCFLLHVLPSGFHRIRHYGLIANTGCKVNWAKARQLLKVKEPELVVAAQVDDSQKCDSTYICPECGGPMVIKEILISQLIPRAPPLLKVK